jgi:predicted GNAT family N-acyltransferase
MTRAVEAREAKARELRVCFAIRRTVFVEGQGVPESLEIDGLDAACDQFVVCQDGEIVGTARLRFVDAKAKAERVAVLDARQGTGLGRVLMEALEAKARASGHDSLVLNAQVSVQGFYERLGYRALGARFMEAGIEHVPMEKTLRGVGSASR